MKKRHTTEEIITLLRKIERRLSDGATVSEACRQASLTAARHRFAELLSLEAEVRRYASLRGASYTRAGEREPAIEEDHCRTGDRQQHSQGSSRGKMVSPSARRGAVEHVQRKLAVSQRRACRALKQARATQRYQPRSAISHAAVIATGSFGSGSESLLPSIHAMAIVVPTPACEQRAGTSTENVLSGSGATKAFGCQPDDRSAGASAGNRMSGYRLGMPITSGAMTSSVTVPATGGSSGC